MSRSYRPLLIGLLCAVPVALIAAWFATGVFTPPVILPSGNPTVTIDLGPARGLAFAVGALLSAAILAPRLAREEEARQGRRREHRRRELGPVSQSRLTVVADARRAGSSRSCADGEDPDDLAVPDADDLERRIWRAPHPRSAFGHAGDGDAVEVGLLAQEPLDHG